MNEFNPGWFAQSTTAWLEPNIFDRMIGRLLSNAVAGPVSLGCDASPSRNNDFAQLQMAAAGKEYIRGKNKFFAQGKSFANDPERFEATRLVPDGI